MYLILPSWSCQSCSDSTQNKKDKDSLCSLTKESQDENKAWLIVHGWLTPQLEIAVPDGDCSNWEIDISP